MLPYDHDAEAAVLGALLTDEDAIFRVLSILSADHFNAISNKLCYVACSDVAHMEEELSLTNVAQTLSERGLLDQIGGVPYLTELAAHACAPADLENQLISLVNTAKKRGLSDVGRLITELGSDHRNDSQTVVAMAEEALLGLAQGRSGPGLRRISELMGETFTRDNGQLLLNNAPRILSGFRQLDGILVGMWPGYLVVIAGESGSGKTALALNIATNAAKHGAAGAVLTMGETRYPTETRLLSAESGMEIDLVQHRTHTGEEEPIIINTLEMLAKLPLSVVDRPRQTIDQIEMIARLLKLHRGIDFLVLDCLQSIRSRMAVQDYDDRDEQMIEIARFLKKLAIKLNIPIIACSRSNLLDAQRPDRTALLSDLSEDVSIEGAADVVILLSQEDRDSVQPNPWRPNGTGRDRDPSEVVDVNVAKHRSGPTGQFQLHFRNGIMRFYEMHSVGDAP